MVVELHLPKARKWYRTNEGILFAGFWRMLRIRHLIRLAEARHLLLKEKAFD